MDTNGANAMRLTDSSWSGNPCWSPDDLKIAYDSDFIPEVMVMNADGTNPANLTNNPASDANPSWSSDGLKIAFSSDRNGNAEIYVMNADGTDPTNLSNDPREIVAQHGRRTARRFYL